MAARAPRRSEAGFTMIELMIAAALVGTALVAMMASLDSAGQLTLEAQRHEQAISIGQREIEELRVTPYYQLDLTSKPNHANTGVGVGQPYQDNPRNPNYYVQGNPGTSFLIKTDYNNLNSPQVAGVPAAGEPFVDELAGGTVTSGPEVYTVGETEVSVWRYITWRDVPALDLPDPSCAVVRTDCDSKRITVAVRPEAPEGQGPTRPIYLSTVVTPPVEGSEQ
jgi:prepilin-type N-terminal cleavage/methylation domain-containing protein